MNYLHLITSRIRALLEKRRLDREMAEEMRFHLEERTADYIADGMSPKEARRAAQRKFGNVGSIQEHARDQRGWTWLEQFGKDFLLAVRSLRKSPCFSIVAIATLAMGMAVTAAMVSVVKGLLLDPLPYPDQGRVVSIWRKDIGTLIDYMPLTTADFFDLQERTTSFAEIGVFSCRKYNLGGTHPEGVDGAWCSASLFRALGVQALHGRLFSQEDEQGDSTAAVLLSHALWRQRFNSDPEIVGRSIRLDGRGYRVVGVMPPEFALLSLWTRDRPMGLWTLLSPTRGTSSGSYWLGSIARLKPGISTGQASEELKVIAKQLVEADPNRDRHRTLWMTPLAIELGGIPALRISILLGAAWTLLVLASKNVAGMLMARGLGRQPEIAVRLAMGARRWHIVRLVLMESLLLSLLASASGFILMLWCLSVLSGTLPAEVMPRSGIGIDTGLVGCIAVLTLISTQMAGLAPALLASRTDIIGSLKEGGVNSSQAQRTQRKLRNLLVGQIATALILVSVALQFSEGYRQMLIQAQKLSSDSVLTASIAAKGPNYTKDSERVALWRHLIERCDLLPGVRESGVTSKLPFSGGISLPVLPDAKVFDPSEVRFWAEESCVSPSFFAAVDAHLIQGRVLSREDDANPRSVVVINRALAQKFWPGENPIGRHVHPAQNGTPWSAEVVGVIDDIRQSAERPARPEMYFPYSASLNSEAFLVIRMASGFPAPVESIQQELGRIDSDLAMSGVKTLGTLFGAQSQVYSVITSIADALTLAVLGMAAVGLYGTLSFHFAQRRKDIGIRLAMGATSRDILRLVFKQAVLWVILGLVFGAAASWMLSTVLQQMLPGLSPINVGGVSVGAIVVFATALLAAWVPAHRATKIDPILALRAE